MIFYAYIVYRAPIPVHVYPVATLLSLVHLHIQSLHELIAFQCLKHLLIYTKCLSLPIVSYKASLFTFNTL